MQQDLYAVYGASGCGRSIMPVARQQLALAGIDASRLVFVDDNDAVAEVNGQRLLSYAAFLGVPATTRHIVLAVANAAIRRRLAQRCMGDGIVAWRVIDANAVIMDQVEIGPGAMISPFVTIGSNVRIGAHFHANLYSYVEHDCVIGDCVTFAPGVHCNGNIVIEDDAYVGAGAMIRQGKPGAPLVIGKGAVVGMGAVVTRSVAPGATVIGNPARPMTRPTNV